MKAAKNLCLATSLAAQPWLRWLCAGACMAALVLPGCGEGATPPDQADAEKQSAVANQAASSKDAADSAVLTAEMAKPLLVEAAAVPRAEYEAVAASNPPLPPRNVPFTWLVMQMPLESDEEKRKDFRYLKEFPRPLDLAEAMLAGTHVSALQLKYITDCQVKTAGDTATGEVWFRSSEYEGRAEFTARRREGKWQIVEFRIPSYNLSTTLQDDGTWQSPGV
jgi:hypothetical protein